MSIAALPRFDYIRDADTEPVRRLPRTQFVGRPRPITEILRIGLPTSPRKRPAPPAHAGERGTHIKRPCRTPLSIDSGPVKML